MRYLKKSATTRAENVGQKSEDHRLASIKEALQNAQGPATAFKEGSTILQIAETASKICLSEGDPRTYLVIVISNPSHEFYAAGASVELVALEEVFDLCQAAAQL